MPVDHANESTVAGMRARELLQRRDHIRVPIRAEVVMASAGTCAGIRVQSKDLSWGGASLVVPRPHLELDDSVVLRFPWREGGSFAARAEVVWQQRFDERNYLGGVSFSRIAVGDEEKLQLLLSMLMRSLPGTEKEAPLAETLEIRFLDRREMLATIAQIRFGSVETTAFKSFVENERICLRVVGFSDLPTLRLRARVLWQKAFRRAADAPRSGLFRVALALEHPLDDLKRVTDPLLEALHSGETKGPCVLLDRKDVSNEPSQRT